MFIYPIYEYNHNWRNINTIYIYNKTGIKRNILTIKQTHIGKYNKTSIKQNFLTIKKYMGKQFGLRSYQHPCTNPFQFQL